ncbi:MAG TPA: glutamyl-tRNA reductase [Acidisarcina sp.]|nr:glutamyl-tRNA reductase [Acidisarcina sp.]
MSAGKNIVLLGVNHKTAPIELREQLAIPAHRLAEATERLVATAGIDEGMILSTCNRVEILTCQESGADLLHFLNQYLDIDPSLLRPHIYEYREQEAVRHLFRVAASLDSMVVGEPQILGQVKESYTVARSVGAVQSNLEKLLQSAFTVAKKVRSETQIGSSSVSIASVAVELAQKIFGSLDGKTVLLVGAGKMSELAARHLQQQGAGTIFVANRTYERAVRVAKEFHGRPIPLDDLHSTADQADIIITSTGAPHPIFRKEHGQRFMQKRRNRPMFFIDIAVPRDVDPGMNRIEGIFVYDIDDLQSVAASHLAERTREAENAESIVAGEVERYQVKLQSLNVVPAIVGIQHSAEEIRQMELHRAHARLQSLTPEQLAAVEALTRGMMNKMLHLPLQALKTAARAGDVTTVDTICGLFPAATGGESSSSAQEPPLPKSAPVQEIIRKTEIEEDHVAAVGAVSPAKERA